MKCSFCWLSLKIWILEDVLYYHFKYKEVAGVSGGGEALIQYKNTFEILISFLDSILISCIMRGIEGYHFISVDKRSDPRYCCCSELHTEIQWRKLSEADVRYCSENWLGTSYSHSNVVTFSPWKEKPHIIT